MVTSEKNNPFHALRLTTAYLYYEPSGQQSAVEMADTLHTMFQGSLAIILVDSWVYSTPLDGTRTAP